MTAERLVCDVFVLGAGPAGMAAAAAAREKGASVVCADLFAQAGGQYHMQPPSPDSVFNQSAQVVQGRAAEQQCQELGVRFLTQTEVFWAEPGFTVFANQMGEAMVIEAGAIVVASGAMERALPFKGWTLPGVMTAGGAQRLIKSNNTSPGKNVVLAGSGPFLLAVANTFGTAGLKLHSYIEMQAPRLSALSLLVNNPGRIREAIGLVRGLRRSGAKVLTRHQVIEAIGTDRLEAVRIAPLDASGRPCMQEACTIEGVDTLCVGYGFQPVIDLTSLLRAEHQFDNALGGWICRVDRAQATTVKGLFAAGETTGIGGSVPARLSGRIAGIHAAQATGRSSDNTELVQLYKQLDHARRFAAGLAELFPFPSCLVDQLDATEILCRCEDVAVADIEDAITEGAADVFSVKMWTRAGMGPCQGRICGAALSALIARRLNRSTSDSGFNRLHMPLRPVPLKVVDDALSVALETTPSNNQSTTHHFKTE